MARLPKPTRITKLLGYFSDCSFDSKFCPGAGTPVPRVRKTRRSTMPERMSTSPMRKSPMVSGRLDSDVSIICTPKQVQTVGQSRSQRNFL